jgi:hypothetical protein
LKKCYLDLNHALFEHDFGAVTPGPTTTKPFDVLAEALISAKRRGDKMAIGLFQRELTGWPSNIAEMTLQS